MVKKGVIPVLFGKGDVFGLINDSQGMRQVENVTCENRTIVYDFGQIAPNDANFRLTQSELMVNMDDSLYEAAYNQHTQEYP